MDESPLEPFTLGAYLRDMALPIGAAVVVCVGASLFLATTGTAWANLAVPAVCIALLGVAVLAHGYLRRRSYYRALAEAIENMEHSWHLPSMVEEPDFLDGRIGWTQALTLSQQAANEVRTTGEDVRAYREYVEAWIHEIKTPLAAASLVLNRLHGEDAHTLKRELERIGASAEQALYFARSQNLNSDYVIAETALADTCRAVCRSHAQLLVERGTIPRIEVPDELTVLADASWLNFVIAQAAVNAAKYGATTLVFSAEVGEEGPSGTTRLVMSDDGEGISAADLPRVTERGFIGANGRAEGSATGMGLYLARTMCERMGLGFAVDSPPSGGTTVTIAFPHDRRLAH